MGILNIKEKTNQVETNSKKGAVELVKILGKEFHTVPDGLDPTEVSEFLESTIGSSDATFKRLEQFSDFRAVAQKVEESIQEARQLADYAREQAEAEAEQQKKQTKVEIEQKMAQAEVEARQKMAQVEVEAEQKKQQAEAEAEQKKQESIKEAAEKASSVLDEVEKRCLSSLDGSYSVLSEAINEAIEKAKRTISEDMAGIRTSVLKIIETSRGQLTVEPVEPVEPVSNPVLAAADSIIEETTKEKENEKSESDTSPSLSALQEGLSVLKKRKDAFERALGIEGAFPEGNQEGEDKAAEDTENAQEGDSLYDGDVSLIVPEGVRAAWVLQLRQRMQETPGVQIRTESGVENGGVEMRLSLSESVALRSILEEMPAVTRVAELRNGKDNNGHSEGLSGGYPHRTTLTIEVDDEANLQPPD